MSRPRPRIIVINLDSDTARLATISSALATAGLTAERFSAVDGRALTPAERQGYDPHHARVFGGSSLTPGLLGNYLSHVSIWRRLAESEDECFLIFEDDAEPAPLLSEFIDRIPGLRPGWDVILMSEGCDGSVPSKAKIPLYTYSLGGVISIVRHAYPGQLATAYLISKRGARKLTKAALPILSAIDVWTYWFWRHGVVIYRTLPPLAHHSMRHGSWTSPSTEIEFNQMKYRLNAVDQLRRGTYRYGMYIIGMFRISIAWLGERILAWRSSLLVRADGTRRFMI